MPTITRSQTKGRKARLLRNLYYALYDRDFNDETIRVEIDVRVDATLSGFFFSSPDDIRRQLERSPRLRMFQITYERTREQLIALFNACPSNCERLNFPVCLCGTRAHARA